MKSVYRMTMFAALVALTSACFVGCGEEEFAYQIEVQNRLPVPVNVSLDSRAKKSVKAGETISFVDVTEGTHILQAEANGFNPVEEIIQVHRDLIWIIEEQ